MEDSSSKLNDIQSEIEKYKLHGYMWTLGSFDTMQKPYDDRELKDEKLKNMLKQKLINISVSNLPTIITFDIEEEKSYIKELKIKYYNHYKVNDKYIYKPEAVYKEKYDKIKDRYSEFITQLIVYYNFFLTGDKTTENYTETHKKIFNHTETNIARFGNVNDLLKKYIKEILELFINEENVSDDIKYMSIVDYNNQYFLHQNTDYYKSINVNIFDNNMSNVRKTPPLKKLQSAAAPEQASEAISTEEASTEKIAPLVASTEETAAVVVATPQSIETIAADATIKEAAPEVVTPASTEETAAPKQAASEKLKEEENNKKEFYELNEKYKGVPGLKKENYTKEDFDYNKELINDYDKKFNSLYIYLRNLCHGIIYEKYIDVDGDAKWTEYKEKNITYKKSKPEKYTKYIHILIYLEILRILSLSDNEDDLAEDIKEPEIDHIKNILKKLREFYDKLNDEDESFIINKIIKNEEIEISHQKKIKIDNLLKLQYISDEISPQSDEPREIKGGAQLDDVDYNNLKKFYSHHPLIKELLEQYFNEKNMSKKKIKKREISTNIATTIEQPHELKDNKPNEETLNKKDDGTFERLKNMAMNMINKEKNPALEEKKRQDMKRELEKKKDKFNQTINDAEKRMDDGDENIVIIQKITAVIYKIILGTIILFTFIIIILHIINIIAFLYNCFIDIGDKYHSNTITRDTYRYKLLKYINYVKDNELPALKNINTSSSGNQEIDNIKRKILKFTSIINIFKKNFSDRYQNEEQISGDIKLKWSDEIKKAGEDDIKKFEEALKEYEEKAGELANPDQVFANFKEGGSTKVLDIIKEMKEETTREETRYRQAIEENAPLLDDEKEKKEPELYVFFSLRFIYLSLKLYLAFFLLLLITFFIYIVINIALKKSSSKVEIPIFPNDVLFKTLLKIAMISLLFIFLNMIMFKLYFVKYIYGGIQNVYIEIDKFENYIRNVLTITRNQNVEKAPIMLRNVEMSDDPIYYQDIDPVFKKLLDDNIEDEDAIMDYIIDEINMIDKKNGEIGPFDDLGEKIQTTSQERYELNYIDEYYWDYQRIKRDIILYILIKHLYNGNKSEKDKIIQYFINEDKCIKWDDEYDIVDESFYSLLANNYRNVPIGTFNFKNIERLINKETEIDNKIYLKVAEDLRYDVNEILHNLQNYIGETNIEFDRENYLVNIGVYFFINLLISVIYLIIVNEIYKKSGYSIF